MRSAVRTLAIPLLFVLLAGSVRAQEELDLAAEIAKAEKRLESHEGGETDADRKWVLAAKERLDLLRTLESTRQRAAELPSLDQLQQEREAVAAKLKDLDRLPEPGPVKMDETSELDEYRMALDAADVARKGAAAALESLVQRRAEAQKAQTNLPAREAEAKRKREGLTGDDDWTKYRIETADLEVRVIEARRDLLNRSSRLQETALKLRREELHLADRSLEREKETFRFAEAAADAILKRDAEESQLGEEEERKAAAAARQKGLHLDAYLHDLKAEARAAEARTKQIKIAVGDVVREIDAQNGQIERVREDRKHLDRRIGFGDAGVARRLRELQKGAEGKVQELKENQRPTLETRMQATQMELIRTHDRIYELQLPLADQDAVRELEAMLKPEERDRLEEEMKKVVGGKRGLLKALRAQRGALEDVQTKHGQLVATVSATLHELALFLEYIRSHLLFSQSGEPISAATFRNAVAELPKVAAKYTDPELRAETSAYVRNVTRAGLLLAVGLVVSFLALIVPGLLRRKAGVPEDDEGERPAFMGRGAATIRFLAAALPPAGFFLGYALLSGLELPPPTHEVLPHGFLLIGTLLAVSRTTKWLLHPAGVGIHVLGVLPESAVGIRRTVYFGAISALFLAVPARLIARTDPSLVDLPRLLHVAWLVILAGCLFVLTRRRGPVLRQIARPGRFLDRFWMLVGPALLFVLLAMVVLEVAGFRVASQTIARAVTQGFVVLVAVVLAYSFLVKMVGKLARKVRSRLVSDLGYEAAQESSDAVSDQLTRLASILIVGTAILYLLGSWDEFLVLFDLLESVELAEVGPGRHLTLLSILRAILAIATGHFIVANLSAVYEFIVFPLLGSTKRGGQFVMLALSRYAILLIAYSLALLFLGLQMSSITWLFAAASVGIGFGLQEIIANFVSGLIILLERPFQVGDVITVDTTDGVVDSISIRSTILTDWDRKSVIIPNKDFITKKMINWTRNDDVTRRRLDVRVALGSDLEKVNRVLLETVTAHPTVLADPPPRIWMSTFEASGIGVIVYFFTRVDDGMRTRSELFARVHDELAGADIEVPVQKHQISVVHEPPASDGFGEEE